MCVLIGNTVKTETAEYPCRTREEAEALYMQLLERERAKEARSDATPRRPVPEKIEG
jgi:hypothetical protein